MPKASTNQQHDILMLAVDVQAVKHKEFRIHLITWDIISVQELPRIRDLSIH